MGLWYSSTTMQTDISCYLVYMATTDCVARLSASIIHHAFVRSCRRWLAVSSRLSSVATVSASVAASLVCTVAGVLERYLQAAHTDRWVTQ